MRIAALPVGHLVRRGPFWGCILRKDLARGRWETILGTPKDLWKAAVGLPFAGPNAPCELAKNRKGWRL